MKRLLAILLLTIALVAPASAAAANVAISGGAAAATSAAARETGEEDPSEGLHAEIPTLGEAAVAAGALLVFGVGFAVWFRRQA